MATKEELQTENEKLRKEIKILNEREQNLIERTNRALERENGVRVSLEREEAHRRDIIKMIEIMEHIAQK